MAQWKFSCEMRDEIKLPPEYTFPRAFNYLNSENNSFYLLEQDNGNYIQCGGSKEECTVEVRINNADGTYCHYVIGREDGATEPATIEMSDGSVTVEQREVFRHWDAIDLFKCFFAGEEFPPEFSLRKTDI